MISYDVFSLKAKGYSHILKGTECEDSCDDYSDDICRIAVIADGHGDESCFRSNIGSSYVAEIAKESLIEFCHSIEKNGYEGRLLSEDKAEPLVRHLVTSIVGEWTERVFEHYSNNPPTEEELLGSGQYESSYRNGQEIPHIYGTTVLAALLTEKYLLIIHQGDGRCVIVHENGFIDQPVPWDDRCDDNVTTSICQPDAIPSTRYYICNQEKNPIIACYLTSDGLEDSKGSLDSLNAYFGELTKRIAENGLEETVNILSKDLPEISENGSHDDMSVGAIVDAAKAAPYHEIFEYYFMRANYVAQIQAAQTKLDSMFLKTSYLKEDYSQAQNEYNHAVEAFNSNENMISRICAVLEKRNESKHDLAQSLQDAEEKLEKVKAEYEEYIKLNLEYEGKRDQATTALNDIQAKIDALNVDAEKESVKEKIPKEETPDDSLSALY